MRTKTLLLAAVLSAAGVASSMAQVYSVNVVGYTTATLNAGFSMISNPLSNGDNTLNSVLTNGVAFGDTIYFFNPATGGFVSSRFLGSAWTPNHDFSPGVGAFYSAGAARTVTFVGAFNVGAQTGVALNAGFQIVGSQLPVSGALNSAAVGFPAASGDTVYIYNGTGYTSSRFLGTAWVPSAPTVNVGQSFWLNRTGAAGTWAQSYAF
jgi:hypothetical protein